MEKRLVRIEVGRWEELTHICGFSSGDAGMDNLEKVGCIFRNSSSSPFRDDLLHRAAKVEINVLNADKSTKRRLKIR